MALAKKTKFALGLVAMRFVSRVGGGSPSSYEGTTSGKEASLGLLEQVMEVRIGWLEVR